MEKVAGLPAITPGSPLKTAGRKNRLLDTLDSGDLASIIAVSSEVSFSADAHIALAGTPIEEVYFPVSGYASLMVSGQGPSAMQVALVGREGLLGWESLLGREEYLLDLYVPETMQALRIDIAEFAPRNGNQKRWRAGQLAYLTDLFSAAARGVLCTRFHVLEARLARCLLEVHDRHPAVPILLTQSTLAHLLGVRRSGVTNAATHLQLLGLIQYRRGEIRLINRRGLEAAACECYRCGVH